MILRGKISADSVLAAEAVNELAVDLVQGMGSCINAWY